MPARRIPVVAINHKGEVVGRYDSIHEAGVMNGIDPCTVSNAIRLGKWCLKHRWMREDEYLVYYFEKRTDELRNSYRESRREAQQKRFRVMGEEGKAAWKRKHSENRKAYLKEHPDQIIRPRKPLLCITTGEKFASASDFARKYGVDVSNVCRSAKTGGRVNGMNVKYLET